MRDGVPQTIFRKDYRAPDFSVEQIDLYFDIRAGYTTVRATLDMVRAVPGHAPLVLDGVELVLESVAIDGVSLAESDYSVTPETLVISKVPDRFKLETQVRIAPETNTSLEGLYRSQSSYSTQCEAEGFRKITYYPDRPDVLALFNVTIEADREACPVLLSNGNLIDSGVLDNRRHRAVWQDPWPKPSYLFALVAGDLACVEDTFVTRSGKPVALRVYVEEKDRDFCAHAIESLKRSMRWDEEVYGLEYDLELFNIVAVDDFNMGAMENKSLNIFNTSCVLASPDITTDAGYQRIESIVAHEYFHNFSGNRVTCRDWFQLSLKEGFTVFRDAEFTSDMHSRGVKRVEDVAFLRAHQFAEDAGPLAHPVRPDSFIEISNFYTTTVYEKGAEVVRMLHTLLGAEVFQRGATHYFETYDGQAVTCDDFVDAMEVASGRDLSQFRRWYSQPGTPLLTVTGDYDGDSSRYRLTVEQSNPAVGVASEVGPLHMPLALGLVVDGAPMTMPSGATTAVVELTEPRQTFVFDGVESEPVPALLRGFSAPVRVSPEPDIDQLRVLMAADDDPFVRWDAAQSYAAQLMEATVADDESESAFLDAYGQVMASDLDPAMKAQTLILPSEDYLADRAAQRGLVDVHSIHERRERLKQMIARSFAEEWSEWFARYAVTAAYEPSAEQIGHRALRHLAADYLCYTDAIDLEFAEHLYAHADNLTDRLAAARCLINHGSDLQRERMVERFYEDWKQQALVVNAWLSLQATRPHDDAVETVAQLRNHPAFDWRNPNKLRSLVGAMAGRNAIAFHRADGAGYTLLTDTVIAIQKANPQMAAGMLSPLTRFRRYAHGVDLMRGQLERVAAIDDLSRDVFEVVQRTLDGH
ncbi:aminopeptidase N [Luminiphilus syltensis NOR5-1B]|uniref:Aminopeptidase N n=1 Tax=Luminiphilus syltensis NOR5-1B TaxID=565045 RepID=B8KXW5_9GAMM|nr:aminopeptidase N [Luminiphilus syltensis]EED34545.1 aminopeptidase N [Luminiphilus syltensis NOR5-1B]